MRWGKELCDGLAEPAKCASCDPAASRRSPSSGAVGRLASAVLLARGSIVPGLGLAALIERNVEREKRLFERADAVVVLTEWARRAVEANVGASQKLHLNRLGVASGRFQRQRAHRAADARRRVSGTWAGPIRSKVSGFWRKPSRFFAAISTLLSSSAARSTRRTCADFASLSRNDARVRFEPAVPPAEVPRSARELRRFDLSLLALEGGPTVALEAHAVGTPVIGSRIGGLAEIVEDGVNGLLVPPGEPCRLARGDGTRADGRRRDARTLPKPTSQTSNDGRHRRGLPANLRRASVSLLENRVDRRPVHPGPAGPLRRHRAGGRLSRARSRRPRPRGHALRAPGKPNEREARSLRSPAAHRPTGHGRRSFGKWGPGSWKLRNEIDIVHSFGRLAALLPVLPLRSLPKLQSYQREIPPRRAFAERTALPGTPSASPPARRRCTRASRSREAGRRFRTASTWTPTPSFRRFLRDAPLVFLGRHRAHQGRASRDRDREGERPDDSSSPATSFAPVPMRSYFDEEIAPAIDGDRVRYVGPVDDEQKNELLGKASALLMPIEWEEPFGIVMIEAMACGTPVIAFARGSVPESRSPRGQRVRLPERE